MASQRRATASGEVRYEVRLRGPDGRERSRTFRTRKAAETYERELLAQRDRGGWVDPIPAAVRLDARGFRGMERESTSLKQTENRR